MKLKYVGTVTKTVNYAENKYLYLIPGKECEVSNLEFKSKRIQKLINIHELKIIEGTQQMGKSVSRETKKESEDIITEAIKKSRKERKKKKKRKKITDFLKSKKGGK